MDDLTRKRLARAAPDAVFFERAFFQLLQLEKKEFDNVISSLMGHVNEWHEDEKALKTLRNLQWMESKVRGT